MRMCIYDPKKKRLFTVLMDVHRDDKIFIAKPLKFVGLVIVEDYTEYSGEAVKEKFSMPPALAAEVSDDDKVIVGNTKIFSREDRYIIRGVIIGREKFTKIPVNGIAEVYLEDGVYSSGGFVDHVWFHTPLETVIVCNGTIIRVFSPKYGGVMRTGVVEVEPLYEDEKRIEEAAAEYFRERHGTVLYLLTDSFEIIE